MNEATPQTESIERSDSAEGSVRAQPSTRRHASTRRVAVAIGFVVIACITACALVALALTQERPRWWASVDATDPTTITTAEAVENGVATALTQVRPAAARPSNPTNTAQMPGASSAQAAAEIGRADTWKVFVTTEQANAWLSVRLRPWLKDQAEQGRATFRWPPELREVQVRFSEGLMHVGARVSRGGGGEAGDGEKERTLAAAIRPEFRSDGSLWMRAETVSIGRLTLPAGWVLPSAKTSTDSGEDGARAGAAKVKEISAELAAMPQTSKVLAAFNGAGPVLSRPVVKLADGRRVRIVGMEAEEGRVVIECRTEERGTAGGR